MAIMATIIWPNNVRLHLLRLLILLVGESATKFMVAKKGRKDVN
jgi:hypothetical protein